MDLGHLIPRNFKGKLRTAVRGEGVYLYDEEGNAYMDGCSGALLSNSDGDAVAYAIFNLQDRGPMFIEHGTKVYAGMIIGEHTRGNDLEVNVLKGKKLTNVRASGTDEAVRLTTPVRMTLEQAIAYIEDDELVEVTPRNIRLRKRHLDVATANFKMTMPFFVIFSILQLFLFGANQAEEVAQFQPVKLAAMEGVWEDTSCAPMTIVGIVDVANQTTYGIKIPCMLSFLAYGDINATVQGLNSFPQENWPPIKLTFHSYHLMINFGMIFVAIGLLGTLLAFWKQKIWGLRPVLWLFVLTIFMAEAATIAGWWTAEFGRQPWIVWELMRTSEGVSPNLVAWQIAASVGMFVVLYAILFILFVYLLNEKIQHGPDPIVDEVPVTSLPDTFKEIFRRKARA